MDQLANLGFTLPTPIQEQTIPRIIEGVDLIGKAETGTGKTLAFTSPIIGQLDPDRVAVQALVLCPTRELAQQVEEVATALGEPLGIRSALVVGGVHQGSQILKLRQGAQVVVGTPGRVLDFLGSGKIHLGWVEFVVLDEADRMLDMGFIDDVQSILEKTSKDRQTLLFSATIPPKIRSLTKRFMKSPVTVSTIAGLATVPEIRQQFVRLGGHDKSRFLKNILDENEKDTCIVFCNTRRAVIELDRDLWGLGYPAGSLHGDHDQDRRFKVLEGFKARQITTLVATDVAARGLDVDAVTRVINYDVPDEVETYVHRIGRTGRAGDSGLAITLVTPKDRMEWQRIVKQTGFSIEEIHFKGTKAPPYRADDRRRGRGGHGKPGRGRQGPGGHQPGGRGSRNASRRRGAGNQRRRGGRSGGSK